MHTASFSAPIRASAPLVPSSSAAPPTITSWPPGRSFAARATRNASQSAADCRANTSRATPVANAQYTWSGIGAGTFESQCTAIPDQPRSTVAAGKIRS